MAEQVAAASAPSASASSPIIVPFADRIQRMSAASETTKGFGVMIFGEGGVGKTTLIRSLPPDKTFVIDVEDRLAILRAFGWDGYRLPLDRKIDGFREAIDYLTLAQHPYKFVVTDSLSALEQWMIAMLTEHRGKIFTDIKEYGDAATVLKQRVLSALDLRRMGINVIFLAHEASDARGAEGISTPAINVKAGRHIRGWCDYVGRMSIAQDGKNTRTIQWDPSPNVHAKNSSLACVQPIETVTRDESSTYLLNMFKRIYHERKQGFAPATTTAPAPKPTEPQPDVAANAPAVGAPADAPKSDKKSKKE